MTSTEADRGGARAPHGAARRRRVLLVAYGGGHVPMVAPVMRQLESRGVECVLMALTTGFLKARQLGLHPVGYRDFTHLVAQPEQVLQWGREFAGGNTHPDVSEEESLWYLGVNFAQWVREHGEEGARRRYRELGRRAFFPVDFMTAVLREMQPDVLVTTNTPRTEGAAIEAAVRLGVPALTMVDLFVEPSNQFCHRAVYADRIAVLSEGVKRSLESAGIGAQRIVATGNPAFDTLASPDMLRQAQAIRRRLQWQDRRVILFAGHVEDMPGTPPEWHGQGFGKEVQRRLQEWVLGHPEDALVVRHHPSESHLYPPLPAHDRMYSSVPSGEPLHPVLLAADVVVVQTSTVGLEAALAGRRVLCLKFAPSVRSMSNNYVDLGLAEGVESFADLERALSVPGAAASVSPADYSVGVAARKVAAEVLALSR